MKLKNKTNGEVYLVSTETDGRTFMIFAKPFNHDLAVYCMHYRTLAEFCEEWEDVD